MAVNCGPVGSFIIRICPPLKGKKFYLQIRNHRVGSNTFQCHKEVVDNKWQGECVICDQCNKFYKEHFDNDGLGFLAAPHDKPRFFSGSVEDFKRELNSIKPSERYYFNSIVRGEEERGVLNWSCGKTIYAKILENIVENESNPNVVALGDITDPKKGFDLHVRRTIKNTDNGPWPDYSSSQFLPSTPMGKPKQVKLWLAQLRDLTALRILSSKEDMIDAMEDVFGHLGPVNSKQKYRSISDPFVPSW